MAVGALDAYSMSSKPSTKPDRRAITKPGEPRQVTKPHIEASTRPPRTLTVPDHMRGPWTQGPETVTALAVEGEDRLHELPPTKFIITVGSQSDRDVVLPGTFISRHHCDIQRRGPRTYVVDADSKNGIVVGDRVEKEFELHPGDRFKIAGRLTVVALNDAMRRQMALFGQLVCRESERREKGGQERPSPLDVLAIGLDVAPVLITGEAGCDHDRLARALHEVSARRSHEIVTLASAPDDRKTQRAIIDAASRSTLIIAIDKATPQLDATFASMLFDRSYNIRIIALATDVATATRVLGADIVGRMNKIALRSIAFRPTVIPWLFDEILRERGSTLHVAALTEPNRKALEDADWKGNFAEMREVADWLIALHETGSIRAAAERISVPRATLARRLSNIGIDVPLTP
jgi:pSer/pThr/pTyr-binding forkhead associated (FHA) protein